MTKLRVSIGTFSAVIFLASSAGAAQDEPADKQAQSLSRAVEHIMRYQERKTSILYPSLPPKVRIAEANEFGHDEVAKYMVLTGDIVLHGRYRNCDFGELADNLESVVSPSETGSCDLTEVRTVLAHELGHFLTHQYIRQNISNSWLAPYFAQDVKPGPAIFGEYMIVEGLGEYFGCLFGICSTPIAQSAWTRTYDIEEFNYQSMLTFFFYTGGYDIVKPIMDARGAKDGMRWLLENKLKIVLPEIAEALSYREKGVSKLPDPKEQEERAQIIGSVLPDLTAEQAQGVLKGCESVSIANLRKFKELARLRLKDDPEDAPIDPAYLDEWFYLIEHNANILGLADMYEPHLPPMVRDFRQGRVPLDLIALIGGSRWEYPRLMAKRDPDYDRDTAWHREQLHKILVAQEHAYRIGGEQDETPDYSETPERALEIKDNTIVILAKTFAEYALSERGRMELSTLIRTSTNGNEEGGIFVWGEQGIKLIPIPNTLTSGKDNGWNPPIVHGYARVFGSVHTHPFFEDIDPKLLAGPSGSAKTYYADAGSDLNALRYYARMGNPYMIWAVVTGLSKRTYNVDLYFRDLEQSPNDQDMVRNTKELTVLDIGNFTVID